MRIAVAHVFLCAYFFLLPINAQSVSAQPAESVSTFAPPPELAPLAVGSTIDPAQAQPVINLSEYTNILWQAAEQNKEITDITTNLFDSAGAGAPPWFLRLLNAFFTEIGSVVAKWIHDFVVHWEAPAASALALVMQQRVFNPNVAASNLSSSSIDNVVLQVRNLNVLMYVISQDLLLLIFILAAWKAWANSTWHSGASLVGPVLRLSFTAMILLGWPTISTFIIQISNEMIKAVYPASGTTDAVQLARALESVIDLGIDASGAALIAMLSPLAATVLGATWFGTAGSAVGNITGQSISFVAMLIFTILASALIFQLVYIVTMQSAQTVLLYAQYIFAPFFLLFFAHPDTEEIASRYIRAVVEASLWTFIWVGLLRLLVIFMTSPFNVWGQVLYAIAIFQLMINTPQFIAKAHISPLSDFVSAGLFSNRTITLVRSYSRQARQLGVRTGKVLIGDHTTGKSVAHKTSSGTRSSSTSRSRVHTTASETLTEQPLDNAYLGCPEITNSAKPPKQKRAPKLTSTNTNESSIDVSAVKPSLDYTSNAMFNSELYGLAQEHVSAGIVLPQSLALTSQDIPANIKQVKHSSHELPADPSTSDYAVRLSRSIPSAIQPKRASAAEPIIYGNAGNQIICNTAGNFKIKLGPGIKPEELTRLHSIVRLARLEQLDPKAHSAALKANAISYDNADSRASSHSELQLQAKSPPSATHPKLSVIKHAIAGAQSFVDNKPGNEYCTYLEHRFSSHVPPPLTDINNLSGPHLDTGATIQR